MRHNLHDRLGRLYHAWGRLPGRSGTLGHFRGRPGTLGDAPRISLESRPQTRRSRGDVHVGNEQLRQALRNAGLEVDDLAVKAEVDVKTVRRWLSGRTPRARYRRRVADALDVSEQVLWPGEVPDHEQADGTAVETFELLTARDAPDWRELLADAQERVELLDLTLGDVIEGEVEQLDTVPCICQKLSPVGRITGSKHLDGLNRRVLSLLMVRYRARPEHLLRDAEGVGDTAAVARAWGAAADPPPYGLDVDLGLDREIVDLEARVSEGLPELLVPHVDISPQSTCLRAEL